MLFIFFSLFSKLFNLRTNIFKPHFMCRIWAWYKHTLVCIASIKMLVCIISIDRCICLPHDNFSSTSPLGADTPALRLSGLLAQTNIQHPSFLKLYPAARKVEDCTNSQIDRTTQIKLKRNRNANFLFLHFWVIYVPFLSLHHL